jgi:hypothetical protein
LAVWNTPYPGIAPKHHEELPFKKLWFLIGPKGPHTCGNLGPVISIIMCVVIDLIPVLTPMPMPYYIFPHAFSGPKSRRGGASSASLLHLRSRLPPCSAVLSQRVPSAEPQCARAWPRVGVPVRPLPVGLPLLPACVPPTGPEPPCACVPQWFNTGVLSPSAPASCCSGSSPEFRNRGPSVLNAAALAG